jgi:hypothetical protein
MLAVGLFAAATAALLPYLATAALAAVPLLWRAASERERRLAVGRWSPLHSLAVGDTQSWSGE